MILHGRALLMTARWHRRRQGLKRLMWALLASTLIPAIAAADAKSDCISGQTPPDRVTACSNLIDASVEGDWHFYRGYAELLRHDPYAASSDFIQDLKNAQQQRRAMRPASLIFAGLALFREPRLNPDPEKLEVKLDWAIQSFSLRREDAQKIADYIASGFEGLGPLDPAGSDLPQERQLLAEAKLVAAWLDYFMDDGRETMERARSRAADAVELDPLNPDAWFTLGILHGLIASQLNPDEGLNRATVDLYKKNAVMELRKAFQLVGTLDPVQGNRYHHVLGLMFGDRANFSGKLPESVLNTYYACGEPDPTILMNMNTAAWCDAWDKMESDLMHKSPQHYYRKRDFGTAIKILPEYVDAHYQLGLSQSTQTAEALQSFNRCIELAPDDARCWRARGELLQKLNRAGEGQSDLERARVLERATSRNDVKWCRDRIGADAIAACSAIIARHPTEVVPYIYRAWTQFVGGDKDLALKDFSKAVDIAPARGDLYYQRGNFYVETKQWREAELDFSKAIELGYDLRGTYVLKGLSLYKKGDLAPAIADLSKAIEQKPDDEYSIALRAEVLTANSEFERAIEDYTTLIGKLRGVLPRDRAIYYTLRGKMYERLGKMPEAASDFEQAGKLTSN